MWVMWHMEKISRQSLWVRILNVGSATEHRSSLHYTIWGDPVRFEDPIKTHSPHMARNGPAKNCIITPARMNRIPAVRVIVALMLSSMFPIFKHFSANMAIRQPMAPKTIPTIIKARTAWSRAASQSHHLEHFSWQFVMSMFFILLSVLLFLLQFWYISENIFYSTTFIWLL